MGKNKVMVKDEIVSASECVFHWVNEYIPTLTYFYFNWFTEMYFLKIWAFSSPNLSIVHM